MFHLTKTSKFTMNPFILLYPAAVTSAHQCVYQNDTFHNPNPIIVITSYRICIVPFLIIPIDTYLCKYLYTQPNSTYLQSSFLHRQVGFQW